MSQYAFKFFNLCDHETDTFGAVLVALLAPVVAVLELCFVLRFDSIGFVFFGADTSVGDKLTRGPGDFGNGGGDG